MAQHELISLSHIENTGDESFPDLFNIKEKIGRGAFGSVWIASYVKNPEIEVAVKVIDRKKLKPKDDEAVYKEIEVMRELSSNNGIIKLYTFFENSNTFHIILELARGGDVCSRLAKRIFYPENDARKLAKSLLTTVDFIHTKGFVHRDLKPDNLLLENDREDCNGLKIADFGFARKFEHGRLRTRCGTPSFVAPEICVGVPYDNKVDIWSIGVIMFLLLGGYPPFQDKDMLKLFRKIRAADYSFIEKYWDPVSTPAKQLIVRMLTVDPCKRITAVEALKSKWLSTPDDDLDPSTKLHLSDTVIQLKKFVAKQKLRGAIIATTYATTAKFWTANTVSFMSKQITLTSISGSMSSTKNLRMSLTNGKTLKNFDSLYQCQYKIRGGRIAEVWLGWRRETDNNNPLAIKIVQKKDMDLREEGRVMNEVAILQSLSHPNILAVHDFLEENLAFYIVMEMMKGGDVFDRIVQKTHYTEKDARDMIFNLLSAVEYFHGRGIAHRDLKPQNLLLKDELNDSSIKVADFSFAKRVHTPKSLFTRCGTPTYVAPEILKNHPHDQSCDMWSIAVIAYISLVGYPPFMEEDQRVLFKKIRYGEYTFYEEDWVGISHESKDFIKQLLVVDPDRRMTASNALRHPWFHSDESSLCSTNKVSNIRELKSSMDDMDEFHEPKNSNYKSFQLLPDSLSPMNQIEALKRRISTRQVTVSSSKQRQAPNESMTRTPQKQNTETPTANQEFFSSTSTKVSTSLPTLSPADGVRSAKLSSPLSHKRSPTNGVRSAKPSSPARSPTNGVRSANSSSPSSSSRSPTNGVGSAKPSSPAPLSIGVRYARQIPQNQTTTSSNKRIISRVSKAQENPTIQNSELDSERSNKMPQQQSKRS